MLNTLISGLSNKTRLLLVAVPILLSAALPATLYSQAAGTASVQGTVTDQTGATIPGATVTITQTATHAARTTTSDKSGTYALPNIAVGAYALNVTMSGFQSYTQPGTL